MVVGKLSPQTHVKRSKNHNASFSKKQGLLNADMLHNLTSNIKKCFPTYKAAVIADHHGFLLHSESQPNLDDNLLALSAVCPDRKFIDLSKYHKIIKPLNKTVNLLVLLDKSRQNYLRYGLFEKILREQNPL